MLELVTLQTQRKTWLYEFILLLSHITLFVSKPINYFEMSVEYNTESVVISLC